MRCTRINRVGEQCRDQAIAGSNFCAYHAGMIEGRRVPEVGGATESGPRRSRFPLLYRIAAGLLLLIFFLQITQSVRGWLGF